MSIDHLYVLFAECLFRSFAHFLIGLFWGFFFGVGFHKFFINLDINPLSDILVDMFFHSVGCLFTLLMFSFAV